MFNPKDWTMLAVTFLSAAGGAMLPQFGSLFQPYPLYCMMAVIFLSLIPIPLTGIWSTVRQAPLSASYLLVLKLVLLPVVVYHLFRWTLPEYAASAMLLSGMSTAVASPFFTTMLCGNTALALVMVVSTSVLVPFTLPGLVQLLMGRSVDISFVAMSRLLCVVIFVPVALIEVFRRCTPKLLTKLYAAQFPVSMVLFAVTNLGIFSKYSSFFHQKSSTLLLALAASTILAVLFFAAGILFSWRRPVADQVSAIVTFGFMNNSLTIIFASQFFGPLEPTTAAIYNIPFFGLFLAIRYYQQAKSKPRS